MKSYEEIAEMYGVKMCPGCDQRINHRTGSVSDFMEGGVLHWAPRRVTRAGMRNFLKWMAIIVNGTYAQLDRDERIYWQNVWVYKTSKRLGIQIPKRLSYTDRAQVAATYRGDQKDIRRWMQRRGL